jgi:Cdc6-like AAA superfamily ATPase
MPGEDGQSFGGTGSSASSSKKAKDLFFPKPFNDEQVRIVQLLEVSDGVVVQGPPGTGKTHTIANVISHYLANGKRVLVTSMKDPALAVLRDQLPDNIRPLAISLLSTELDGMKQFEHAIHKIASEVQSIDRTAMARQIVQLETNIDALHGQMGRLDYEIARWARANLESIDLDGERIDPQDAAREVVRAQDSTNGLRTSWTHQPASRRSLPTKTSSSCAKPGVYSDRI